MLVELASKLAEVSAKNGFDSIMARSNAARQYKDLSSQANAYEAIINDLVQKNNDLLSISRRYKEEYERVTVSDEDIEHLQNTLKHILNLISSMFPQSNEHENQFNTVIELLNKDTLKTMQLLGFNYKKAIDDPLTTAVANFIEDKLSIKNNRRKQNK